MKGSTLGAYIRALRHEKGMTQAQLADLVGVTDKAVSKWERDVSYPDVTLFPKLADILGVTVDDMLGEVTDEGRSARLMKIFEMSHDIRTPLHIILGCVYMAELHRRDAELVQRYLESIRISGEYLLKTLERFLAASGLDTNKKLSEDIAPDVRVLAERLKYGCRSAGRLLANYDFTGKRILIAEDIEVNREIATELLKETGAEIDLAEDGQVCVEMVSGKPAGYYDLILMDLRMPRLDGFEATERIRRLPDKDKAAVPIVALSADVYEKDRQRAREAGMDGFAEKPIFIERLFEMITPYLTGNKDRPDG